MPWKATAGLHRPRRHWDAKLKVWHHGFLNVFIAGVLRATPCARRKPLSAEILADRDGQHFRFENNSIAWKNWHCSTEQIANVRGRLRHQLRQLQLRRADAHDLIAMGLLDAEAGGLRNVRSIQDIPADRVAVRGPVEVLQREIRLVGHRPLGLLAQSSVGSGGDAVGKEIDRGVGEHEADQAGVHAGEVQTLRITRWSRRRGRRKGRRPGTANSGPCPAVFRRNPCCRFGGRR